jgi:hypothetical protein
MDSFGGTAIRVVEAAVENKPADFFVGVIDFFSVLLPGALLSAVLAPRVRDRLFGPVFPQLDGDVETWVAFIFASYLLGHLVFLLASFLDHPYDWIRKKLVPFKKDQLYLYATRLKENELGNEAANLINTFRWSKAFVELRHPKVAVEIHRFEADSKFFRSFVFVLLFIACILFGEQAWGWAFAVVFLMGLSFWRYAERRWKSTRIAYEYLITAVRISDRSAGSGTAP